MKKNVSKILAGLVVLAFLLTVVVNTAMAAAPPLPPSPPELKPKNTGGGGGGSYDYSHNVFQPYTLVVLNLKSIVVGHIQGKSTTEILIDAGWNDIVDGRQYGVNITGNLNSKPVNPIVDMTFKPLAEANIPGGLISPEALGVVDIISKCDGGSLDIKQGTVNMSFKVPGHIDTENTEFYVVRSCENGGYELLKPAARDLDCDEAVFEVTGLNSIASKFTVVKVLTSVPTPTPTAVPSATPTPTPEPGSGMGTVTMVLAVLAILGVAAAAGYFLVFRKK